MSTRAIARTLIAAAPVALAASAHAQTVPPAPALGEIVVTAEKRETNIQLAPVAITALPAAGLQERNVNELADLNGYVPGLTVTKSEGNERIVAIRGIGYESPENPNSQPGVAFHIDGVYVAHVAALNQDLIDVDHVEVLRGPQGTVFGQSSTGGAINVITRRPVLGQWSGEAQASGGNHGYAKGQGTINVPLGDTLALRASLQYLRHDGYGSSVGVPGVQHYALDDANDLGSHAVLLWQPSDRFTATLAGQTFDARRHAAEQKCVLCRTSFIGTTVSYQADPEPGARTVDQDYPGRYRTQDRMISLTLAEQLGGWGVVKSVSAYQYLDKHQTQDNDRLAYADYFDNIVRWRDRSKTFTEEVTISSPDGARRLAWTAGAFYLRQHALQDILEVSAAGFVPDPEDPTKLVSFATDSPYQHSSVAGYGQAVWQATDRLGITAGARYSWDRITAQPVQYFAAIPPKAAESDAVTGKLSLEYRPSDATMAYLTGSTGYKPTGLNFNSAPLVIGQDYRKERVTALELGSKNRLLDRRLQINAAAYYYWYHNFQYEAEDPVPNQGGTANIPHAETYGIEIEASAVPVPALRLDGNVSLARGRFKGNYYTIDAQTAASIRALQSAALGTSAYDPRVIAAVAAGSQNTAGNPIPRLPGVQGAGSATYTARLASGTLTLRGEVVYRGRFRSRIFDVSAFDIVPAYTIGNLFAQWAPAHSRFTYAVSATNVTNAAGVSNRFANPYGSGDTSVEFIDPRQVFGTISWKF